MRAAPVFLLLSITLAVPAAAQVCPPNFGAGHSVEYYDVTGTKREALEASLDRNGPGGAYGEPFHGQVLWCLRWSFVPWKRRGGCELVHVSTTLHTRMILPRWADTEGASTELAGWWELFFRVLEAHEEVHLSNAREAEAAIAKALASVEPDASCFSAARTADRLAQDLYWEYRERDQKFDRDTRHGRVQFEEALANWHDTPEPLRAATEEP